MNLSVGTPDCMFVYADNNLFEVNRYIKKSEIYNNNSYMRITYNDALEFNSSSGEKIKFALIRTKIKFILYNCDYERNTYGELIDVSISHKDTFDIMYFFNNLKNNITRYRLEYNDKNLYFIGPSLEYMIKELENILFKVNILPWYDEKYKKRINRLMYLYFVELFIKLDNSYDRYTTLNKLKDELLNKSFVKIETNLKIDNLITNIIAIKDTENENFDDFINVIIQNLNFLIITLSNIEGYCNTDGKITKEDIYEGNVGSLI
jgi:hypothetical protein